MSRGGYPESQQPLNHSVEKRALAACPFAPLAGRRSRQGDEGQTRARKSPPFLTRAAPSSR
ncbi:hypothetical protein CN087_13925 [Sinorhizobium meliloti]|nr:hypothetical protein CN087_13925 [Sinorhizobium meliloti]